MSYVTQGTIQVELNTSSAIKIKINPTQEYSAKCNGKTFIVFIDYDPYNPRAKPKAVVFQTTEVFTTKNRLFLRPLIDAATKQTKIEITLENLGPSIESIKIPATIEPPKSTGAL